MIFLFTSRLLPRYRCSILKVRGGGAHAPKKTEEGVPLFSQFIGGVGGWSESFRGGYPTDPLNFGGEWCKKLNANIPAPNFKIGTGNGFN